MVVFVYKNIGSWWWSNVNGLTEKQKQFCDEYLIDFNATRAYKAVYKSCKKEETASANSSRLLRTEQIKAYIAERQRDLQKRTEVTQDKVIKELAKIGFSDLKNYLHYRTAKTVVGVDENGEKIVDYSPVIDLIDSEQVDTSVVKKVSISRDGVFSFELHDKQKALEMLGKHLGLFTEKKEDNTEQLDKLDQVLSKIEGKI